MDEDFFDRLDKYMKFNNLNDNKVTVKSGIPVGALGKQRKGARGLSIGSIAKILCFYSDLNADWLITGRGEMLNSSYQCNDTESIKDRLIEAQQELNEARKEVIDMYHQRDYYKNLLDEHGISVNYNAKKVNSA